MKEKFKITHKGPFMPKKMDGADVLARCLHRARREFYYNNNYLRDSWGILWKPTSFSPTWFLKRTSNKTAFYGPLRDSASIDDYAVKMADLYFEHCTNITQDTPGVFFRVAYKELQDAYSRAVRSLYHEDTFAEHVSVSVRDGTTDLCAATKPFLDVVGRPKRETNPIASDFLAHFGGDLQKARDALDETKIHTYNYVNRATRDCCFD